jgi:hypothetical protein
MTRTTIRSKDQLLNLRIDPELKAQFAKAARAENKPIAEALRELMRTYVEAGQQREFAAEARRQSQLIASSPDEVEVLRWMEDVSGNEDFK